ncbi:MAG: hypothetical protein JSV42_07895 [Chloroflexota bacterium]|nr:MAG: hypothetical protein JSV42_07895 [Chloroflexota bacterium]
MQNVGVRNDPSILRLALIVVVVVAILVYTIISFATGDFLWFSNSFRETPNAIVLHCYGESIEIDPGTFHFSKLKEIMNESMTGKKRWDSLTMSEQTYLEYQTSPQMIMLEFFYPEPVRVHSTYKFYSNVDNLVVPIKGRHAQTKAVFGQANGIPTGGSLHIDSIDEFVTYLNNMELCPVGIVNTN